MAFYAFFSDGSRIPLKLKSEYVKRFSYVFLQLLLILNNLTYFTKNRRIIVHFLAKQHLRIQEAFLFFRFYTFLCGLQPSARKKCIKCRATSLESSRTTCRVGKLLMHIAHHTPPPILTPYLLQALRIV